MQKKSAKLTFVSVLMLLVLAPVSVILCFRFLESRNYYISAVLIIIFSILPFFVYFENRKIKTAEIVLVAMMIALCVASRGVMAFVPQVKPTCALVIVTAIAFGPNVGFVTGSLSMLLSNFLFGQGMFTPFQMLGMGLVGFFCGLIFYAKRYNTNRIAVSITGGLVCFFVYGLVVDFSSVLMMVTDFNIGSVLSIYLAGISFNIIHGVTTAVLLFFINKPMTDKFSRLRIKYGIFEAEFQ